MNSHHTRLFPACSLLVAAVVWLVSVTLCSTRTVAFPIHGHAADGQAGHCHDAKHKGCEENDGCACESFKNFSMQNAKLVQAPILPAATLQYILPAAAFFYESAAISITAQNTGPPAERLLSDLVMERCSLNHAPPLVA